jgi:PAS domain-containing protein
MRTILGIENRILFLVMFILVFLCSFIVYEGIRHHDDLINSATHEQSLLINYIADDIFNYSYTPYLHTIKRFINDNEEISRAFAMRDREKLLELCLPELQSYRATNPFFHAIDFNLPSGRVFLRVQKPELFGDDISQSREIVAYVHKNRKQQAGFDIGKHGAIYWVVEPVYYNGVYLGIVEFGIEAKQLELALGKSLRRDVTSVLKAREWQKAVLENHGYQAFSDYVLMTRGDTFFDQVPAEVSFSTPTDQKVLIGDGEYILHNCAFILDFKGEPIGQFILFQDISDKVAAKRKFIVLAILLSLALIIFTFMVLSHSFDFFITRLEKADEKTAAARDELQNAHDELEKQVGERTLELSRSNEVLKEAIRKNRNAEDKLDDQEKFHKGIIEALPIPLYVIDATDYSVIMANKTAREFLGEFCQGQSCYSLTHNESQPCSDEKHPCPLKEVKEQKKAVTVEHHHFDQTEKRHAVKIYAYPIFDQYGKVNKIVSCTVKIADKKG